LRMSLHTASYSQSGRSFRQAVLYYRSNLRSTPDGANRTISVFLLHGSQKLVYAVIHMHATT
jgi:hypothetical protein